jgi:hypothetical protein
VVDGDVVDGFRIDIAAPAPAPRDRFLLEPVSPSIRSIARALDDPAGIAAASPVTATVAAANTGTAAVASLAATSPTLNRNLTATITFTDNLGNYSWSLVDTTSVLPTVNGTGTWVAGQPDRAERLSPPALGSAEERRLARRREDDGAGRQTTATPTRCSRCATRRWSASVRSAPASSLRGVNVTDRLRGGARDDRRSRAERGPRCRAVGGGRERRETAVAEKSGSQPRRGGGSADPVPAELPGGGADPAGRAVGVRLACCRSERRAMRIATANAFDVGIDTLARSPVRAELPPGAADDGQARSTARATTRPPRRAPSARWRASGRSETSQRAVDASKVVDHPGREHARRRRATCCSARAS